jgi:hypothetical protein
MDRALSDLASPAAVAPPQAAGAWSPMTGFPTWPALSRGRYASTVTISLGVAIFVFTFVQRLTARAAT